MQRTMTVDEWLKLLVVCVFIVLLVCACTAYIFIGYGLIAK